MITKLLKPKDYYDFPRMEVIYMHLSSILCSSPGAGENEEIGFEDWTLDGLSNIF